MIKNNDVQWSFNILQWVTKTFEQITHNNTHTLIITELKHISILYATVQGSATPF